MPSVRQDFRPNRRVSHPGDRIAVSGLYRVHHLRHRPPHEVTLLHDEVFPPCARCGNSVSFELVKSVPRLDQLASHIRLFQIPDDEDKAA